MSNKLMEQSLLERKNKHSIDKLNSIIKDYQSKLDQRVNQVILEMITHTKKISDPPLLPILRDKKMDSQREIEKNNIYRHRNKSSSQYAELSFLTNTSLESEVSQLRNTFKDVESNKVIQLGRSVGSHSIVKPKFTRRKPDIVPKQIRLNPLHERNAIKAYELDKGVMSLIEKGKIGKDINIITAFQKGRPILQTQKVIFHQGEERFAQLEGEISKQTTSPQKEKMKIKTDKNEARDRERMFQESWAITMPKEEASDSKIASSTLQQQRDFKSQSIQLSFKQQIYVKILHYKVQEDKHYKQIMNKNLNLKVQIIQILHEIAKLMKKYSIQVGYADVTMILTYVTKPSKLNKEELFNCISGYSKNNDFKSLKNVRGKDQKFQLALDKIVSSLRYNLQRKNFLKYLKKKKIANHIYGWGVSCWTVKKHRQLIHQRRRQIDQEYKVLQSCFRDIYSTIQQKKHYQIHLINEQLQSKEDYKDILNIQIIKIFNIKNINKHIIYLLPHQLDEETINYYYKIMELEEIPNYKERVWFLQADPQHLFKQSLNLTAKLYYNSKVLRKLKRKIKDSLAYFVVSYPSSINIQLAVHLNIPILSGDLNITLNLEKRTSLNELNQEILQRLSIEGKKHPNLFSLSDEMGLYCQNNKRVSKYVVKINDNNKSKGTALLTSPFTSLPEMYSNTTLISHGIDVDTFYHKLLRDGGIIQKYQEGISFIAVVLNISLNGNMQILGTFEKISSGFVNIAYIFPQKKIDNKTLSALSLEVGEQLFKKQHFGSAEITFVVNDIQDIFLQKVQCYSTHLSSALDYYKFLSDGQLSQNGDYMAKIIDTFENQGKEEEVVTYEPRSFCYVPFLLHFGLSDRQANSFFQLCRMGGVSFDLQNKYGATFILLGSIKSSMGLIATAKDKKSSVKLMLKSLEFIIKQNSHNMSNNTLAEKEIRMKERENIINIKERLENL